MAAGCPKSFHLRCLKMNSAPEADNWYCDECVDRSAAGTPHPGVFTGGGEADMQLLKLLPQDGNSDAVSLAQLMQQLELIVPHASLYAAAVIVRRFVAMCGAADPWPEPGTGDAEDGGFARRRRVWAPPALYSKALAGIASVVGHTAFLQAVDTLQRRGPVVAFAFGTMASIPTLPVAKLSALDGDYALSVASVPVPSQLCRMCGEWRVLRSVCLHCGTSHRFANGGAIPSSGITVAYGPRLIQRVKRVIASPGSRVSDDGSVNGDIDGGIMLATAKRVNKAQPSLFCTDVYAVSGEPGAKPDDDETLRARKVYAACVMQLRQSATSRGFQYLRECANDMVSSVDV